VSSVDVKPKKKTKERMSKDIIKKYIKKHRSLATIGRNIKTNPVGGSEPK